MRGAFPVAGDVTLGEAVGAPGQDLGWGVGVVQRTLVGGLLEELFRVVACGLGFGEGGGQCGPGGVVDDLLGVVGHDGADLLSVPFGSGCWWGAPGEGVQGGAAAASW